MYLSVSIILVAMVAAFVVSTIFLKSTEISMVIAGVVGVAFSFAHGWTDSPIRVLTEGLFTNFDLAILFVTASLFVNVYSHTGAMTAVTRKLVGRFENKWVLLCFMAIFMLIPGAITGAGSVSVFVMGALVATVVRYMGLSAKKTAAFVFIFAILSAAAPPINLWTMMMTAQANMPYVGFEKLLLIPILIVSVFTIIFLGWGSKRESKEVILKELPEAPANMNWVRIILPLLTLVVLLVLSLVVPTTFSIPVLGMPLIFVLSMIVSMLCNPKKTTIKEYYHVMKRTMEQVFPLLATVLSVGVMQNVMAAAGVKGLIGITFVTLPMVWIYVAILFIAPFSQACMSYGSAIVIATPLIFMFNTAGIDTTVVAAALSLMFPIGDCLPPSRIVGRITCETVGYEGSYGSFLKQIILPCLLLGGLALIMLVMPGSFTFLK